MGNFFKMVGATIVGLLLWTIVMCIFSIIGMAGIMASESTTTVEDGSILRINLSGMMSERSETDLMGMLRGDEQGLALDQLLEAIDKASTNENVKGIYLEGGALMADPAQLQELRQALVRFKKDSKKFVIAYADAYTQGSYYICSMADEVCINPEGSIDWHGLAAQPVFYTDVMKKLGIKAQVFKVGTFKSAVEPFINTEMSEPNRQQVTSYLGSIWKNMTSEVAASRKLTADDVNLLADSMMAFRPATLYKQSKMVDKLVYKDEVRDLLKKKTGTDEDESLTFVSVGKMADSEAQLEKHDDCIAIYYAYGDIVDDISNGLTNGMTGEIAPEPMNQDLENLLKDDDIKAVVIRVNSGGGSAYASEQIWREVTRLKAKKPVVISMGGLAASGGYYISCNATRIVAEPTTLTGSIGIFGMIPDISELTTQKIGLHYDVVKTNKYGDMGTQSRPLNADEGRLIQAAIERGYDLFTRRVAEGRKMSQDSVKAIAEGRVWTGEQAIKIGLVDELGDLQAAIKAAAKLAKTTDYSVDTYPAPTNIMDKLMKTTGNEDDYLNTKIKAYMGEYYDSFTFIKNLRSMNPVQARMMPVIIR